MEVKRPFFPIVTIKDVKPLLQKDGQVFSYEISATFGDKTVLKIYENEGYSLNEYVGAKMECLLEITKGKFEYPENNNIVSDNTLTFRFQWSKRAYEFFPELMAMQEQITNVKSSEEAALQQLFDTKATRIFAEWGLKGLHLGIDQDKPMLSSAEGFFLLNEYEFEEEIEELELDQEVCIRVEEVFLRGIRPCITEGTPVRQLKVIPQPEKKDTAPVLQTQPEPAEKKKGRSRFFID